MDPARIRKFLEARPFKPFKLVLPSDRELDVPHPEFMAISPVSTTAIVWRKNGVEEFLDLRWVISVKAKASAMKRR